MDTPFSVNGKIALVTGASSGIGLHLAKMLAKPVSYTHLTLPTIYSV